MKLVNLSTQPNRPVFKGGPPVPWHVASWYKDRVFQHGWVRPLLDAVWLSVESRKGYVQANHAILDFQKRAVRGDLWLSMDEEELRNFCDHKARQCYLITNRGENTRRKVQKVAFLLARYEIAYPGDPLDFTHLANPALLRCADSHWWRRQVRNLQRRELEEFGRENRIVHKKAQTYCTDLNVGLRARQKTRNRNLLSEMIAVNQEGDQYTLEELAELSVSNPAIRRAELMTRIAGFEELANRLGYAGEFYTLTCPSKYHSAHISGIPNEKYAGASVRESSVYLNRTWARIRAKLKRDDINLFGFRIAEPNHDGTCHWHLLLFMPADNVGAVRSIFTRYALQEDGDEAGAREHRFKAVAIDKNRGTAAGYIAKYVAKNIDGHGLDSDTYGNDARASSGRVDAWASIHGIRQFQQIGGPSVTVWRELRRLNSEEKGLLEEARLAADSANWADFCELMGAGRSQAIQLAKWHEFDPTTGEMFDPPINRYGEKTNGKIFGVICDGLVTVTRTYRWLVTRADNSIEAASKSIQFVPEYIRQWLDESRDSFYDFGSGGAQAPPLEYCQ